MESPAPLIFNQDYQITVPGFPNGNSTPRLQRVIRNTGALDVLLPAPIYNKVPTNYYSPSYDTPGSPKTPRRTSSQTSLGKPRRPFENKVANIAPDEYVVDSTSKRRRTIKLPRSFRIGLLFFICFAILGAIFGIVSAEIFIKRGYFISSRNRVPLYSNFQPITAPAADSHVTASSLRVIAASTTTPQNMADGTNTISTTLNAAIGNKAFSSANLFYVLSLTGPLQIPGHS